MKLSDLKEYKIVSSAPTPIAQTEPAQGDLLDRVGGAINSVVPGAQLGKAVGTSIHGITEAVKQRSFEPLRQAGAENAANMGRIIGDTANAALTAGSLAVSAPATALGRVAQGVGIGGALAGTGAVAQGADAATAAKTAALGGAVGGSISVAGEGVRQLGKLMGKAGDKVQLSVIKPSQADIKDGFKIETVKKFNLGGSLKQSFEKTDKALDSLSQQLNQKLASANTSVDLSKVYENTAKRVLGNKFEQFGANSAVDRVLDQLRGEITSVAGQNGLVSVVEGQTIKRAAGHFGAWTYGAPSVDATAQQKVYNTFYNEMKKAIEDASPEGVREINKQISELIPVMNALIRRIPVAERNSALSLTDIITMSAATLEPRALALTLANLASKSGRVGAALSKTGERIANPASSAVGNAARTVTTNLLGSTAKVRKEEEQ